MPEETLDGGNANGGTPAQPNAGGSQGQGDSNSSSASQTQSLEAVLSRLDELDKRTRALQGEKDRGVSKTQKDVEELKNKIAQIDKLTKRGMSQDEAFEYISERDALLEAAELLRSQKSVSAQTSPVGNGAGMAVDKAKILAQYGLNENDPDVQHALQSESDVEKVALRVAFKRSQKQPDPAAAPATSTSTQATNQSDLMAQYQKRLAEMRATSRPSPIQISDLKSEFRKKGLDIW